MNMNNKMIDFDGLDAVLHKANLDMMPAEAHGILCGLLCYPELPDVNFWLNEVMPNADMNNVLVQEARDELTEVYDMTVEQVTQQEPALDLVMPDDETGMDQRLMALSEWCHGFSAGVAVLGLTEDLDNLPTDSREFFEDIIEITRADPHSHSESNNDEAAYMELVEYIRVGAMLMITEMQDNAGDALVRH